MGYVLSKIMDLFASQGNVKVILVGLDNAGKTTTLYKLLLNEVVVTAPTIGSNVEEVQYKNIKFVMWDLGGQESSRSSWSIFYKETNAVILVVDSTDRERIPILRNELERMLGAEALKQACLLVYANKQDVKDAMTAAEISDALQLHAVKGRGWHIQESCALTGFGLNEGLDWIARSINKH
jgi:ADP-ribosylation factor-like protein 5B